MSYACLFGWLKQHCGENGRLFGASERPLCDHPFPALLGFPYTINFLRDLSAVSRQVDSLEFIEYRADFFLLPKSGTSLRGFLLSNVFIRPLVVEQLARQKEVSPRPSGDLSGERACLYCCAWSNTMRIDSIMTLLRSFSCRCSTSNLHQPLTPPVQDRF